MRNTPKRVVLPRFVQRRRQGEAQHAAAVGGIDDPIVPKPGTGVIRMSLLVVLRPDRCLEGVFLRRVQSADPLRTVASTPGRLLPAHDGDTRVRPHEQEPRIIGPAAHAIIPRTIAAADNHRQLRHRGGGDSGDQLGAILGDAARTRICGQP